MNREIIHQAEYKLGASNYELGAISYFAHPNFFNVVYQNHR